MGRLQTDESFRCAQMHTIAWSDWSEMKSKKKTTANKHCTSLLAISCEPLYIYSYWSLSAVFCHFKIIRALRIQAITQATRTTHNIDLLFLNAVCCCCCCCCRCCSFHWVRQFLPFLVFYTDWFESIYVGFIHL